METETATLRIKFQPLLQDVDKDANCLLEIVPQVTAANDINKIKWALDDDLVEYTVPMTYKIIIKKDRKRKSRVDSETSIKVYHSCVDLLHSYSIENANADCGDIPRVVSDNFFLTRFTSSVDQFRRCKANEKKKNDLIRTSSSAVVSSTEEIRICKCKTSEEIKGENRITKSFGVHNLAYDAAVICQLPVPSPFNDNNTTDLPKKRYANKATSFNKESNIECDMTTINYKKEIGGSAYRKYNTPIIYCSTTSGNDASERFGDSGTQSDSNRKLTISAVYSFDTSNIIDLQGSVDSYVEEFSQDNVTEMKDVGTFHMNDDSIESRKIDAVKLADRNVTRALMSVLDVKTSPMVMWNKKQIKITRSLNTEHNISKKEENKPKPDAILNKEKSKPSVCRTYNSNNITYKKSVSSYLSNGFDIFDEFKPKNVIENKENTHTNIETRRSSLVYRPTVANRVAKFTSFMEREILPLKLQLNDIRNKCTSLGILFTTYDKPQSNNTLLYKNVKIKNRKDTRVTKIWKTDSNRVVYSMVFNG